MSQGVGRSEERERGREKEEGLFGGAVRTHTMFTNSNNHSSNSEDDEPQITTTDIMMKNLKYCENTKV